MSYSGDLRDQCFFERAVSYSDGAGGQFKDWQAIDGLSPVWGAFYPERGRERVEAGRVENALSGTLKIRYSSKSKTITEADRVKIEDVTYAIHSISNPDRRKYFLEMTIEKGAGD